MWGSGWALRPPTRNRSSGVETVVCPSPGSGPFCYAPGRLAEASSSGIQGTPALAARLPAGQGLLPRRKGSRVSGFPAWGLAVQLPGCRPRPCCTSSHEEGGCTRADHVGAWPYHQQGPCLSVPGKKDGVLAPLSPRGLPFWAIWWRLA